MRGALARTRMSLPFNRDGCRIAAAVALANGGLQSAPEGGLRSPAVKVMAIELVEKASRPRPIPMPHAAAASSAWAADDTRTKVCAFGTVRRPPRGVPKTEFAQRDFYDVWLPNLAPTEALLKSGQSARRRARRGRNSSARTSPR